MIQRLQYILERYLLTSRSDSSRRFVKLAKASVCHVSFNRGGLQMPRLTDTIKKQLDLLLQQLFWMEMHELWKAITTALPAYTLPAELQLSTFDFLSCLFFRRTKLIPFKNIPPWWQFSWFVWSTLPKLPSYSPSDPVALQAALLRANV
ncbi:uncharacterized protein PHALS_00945 [Plasmopara halstedii]|uniref:Uncharacterized protein n=1 Tax=Plasmopara halstedii TaxID=4781 RepID=A0A0P1AS66_PLAHL|nr:uncharacterized protein PHALS_00945 [Plasmopara halstedii]CEG44596.1 hypothetical protein PHALS_00945 [Plasmopara halstedii]|eukprot:XP_024580965.1 hypothetical protein PHALS_00945 [Plasmopara halstedii]